MISRRESPYGSPSDFTKGVREDGEEVFIKTNAKTGEVLEILTKEEAERRGILDNLGNIKKSLDFENSVYDELTKNLPHKRDMLILGNETSSKINDLKSAQLKLHEEVNRLMKMEAEQIARRLGVNASFEGLEAGHGPVTGTAYADILKKEMDREDQLQTFISGVPRFGLGLPSIPGGP